MNKDEILAKNKQDGLDERERVVYNKSFGIGSVVVGILCLAFSLYNLLNGKTFFEFVSIMTAYLCTTLFYQFYKIRKIIYFIGAVICLILAVGAGIGFVVNS